MARRYRETERSPEQLLIDNLDLIERLVVYVCKRSCLRDDEADEFGAEVKLALVEDNYSILRGFRGKSKLSTYLTVVILNQARDYRTKRCGRWRPSVAAQRLGVAAVELETLLSRDGFSLRDATEMLRRHHGVKLSALQIGDLAARLPVRSPRCRVSESWLEQLPAEDRSDLVVRAREEARGCGAVSQALKESVAELSGEDRIILRMHFQGGLKIASISRSLGIDQGALYRRVKRLLTFLRRRMTARGFARAEVR